MRRGGRRDGAVLCVKLPFLGGLAMPLPWPLQATISERRQWGDVLGAEACSKLLWVKRDILIN